MKFANLCQGIFKNRMFYACGGRGEQDTVSFVALAARAIIATSEMSKQALPFRSSAQLPEPTVLN